MVTNMKCLRCDEEMRFIARENLQLGKTGWVLGDIPNLIAGALNVSIYMCPKCNKLEFFSSDEYTTDDSIPQKVCPKCGTKHDFDYPKCPRCKYEYQSNE